MYGVHICLSKETEQESGSNKYMVQIRAEERDREKKRGTGKEKNFYKRNGLFLYNDSFYSECSPLFLIDACLHVN